MKNSAVMMNKSRIYIDSCCIIDVAKGIKAANQDEKRKDDIWYTEKLLKAAENKEIEILTSTLTIAECLHIGESVITEDSKRLFRSVLTSDKVITLVDVTLFIAERARDLRWDHNINTKRAADMIHIATALEVKCEEYLSNDFEKKFPETKKKIESIGLKIVRPSDTTFLPEQYKQEVLDKLIDPAENEKE